jgi:hypothetical protein
MRAPPPLATRSLLPAVVVALAIGGCGGSGSAAGGVEPADAAPRAVRAQVDGPDATARAFARAVLSGRTARMCRLLRGQARRAQDCGGMGEDFGPMLRLTIRSPGDVRVVSVSGSDARAAFPRLGRDARRRPRSTWCRPQQMRLRQHGSRWFVVELTYGSDFEPVRAGC